MNYTGARPNIVTARRPHAAAFETLDQTGGRASPYLLLSDKENRAVSAARLLPLPDVAVAQIAAYRRHLERVAARFHLEAPEIAGAALDGTGPSFFVIIDAARKAEPLAATELWRRADTPDDVRSNWPRHFLRRALPEAGVPGALIDGFFGHGGVPSNQFRPASAMTLDDLQPLRQALEAIASRPQLLPIEGWTE